ncbi:MAG: DUF4115 domain-containing protein [Azospirillaceae bacterium]
MAQSKRQYFSVIVEPELGTPRGGEPEPDGGTSVAAVLRRARQQTGYALPDVATTLRIRLRYLEAIEDGRFDDLPGSVYAVGFIRTYAEFLNLDTEEMVRRFKDEVAGLDRQTELNFPAPAAESRVPGGAVLLIAAVLAVVAYGGWYYLSSAERGIDDLMPRLPDRFAALLSEEPVALAPEPSGVAPGDAGAGTGADPADDTAPATGSTGSPAPAIGGSDTAPRTAETLETTTPGTGMAETGTAETGGQPATPSAPVPPAESWGPEAAPAAPVESAELGTAAPSAPQESAGTAAPDGTAPDATASDATPPGDTTPDATTPDATAPEATGGDVAATGPAAGSAQASADSAGTIVIRAVADSWVQVRDGEGDLVMTRVLRPGDEYLVPDRPGLTLITGNAGGLEISVDGRTAPSIGGDGDVVRGVALDGGRLLQGTAAGG